MKPAFAASALCLLAAACGGEEPGEQDDVTINFDYHTYESLGHELEQLASRYPERCQLEELGVSVEGRTLRALRISDNVGMPEGEPVVYIEGGIHGSEWIATETSLHLAEHLCREYQYDPGVRERVDELDIWVLPLANPDGHVRVEEGEFTNTNISRGRKNAAVNPGSECIGVNLNRQFDYHWEEGGTVDPCDGNYRGTAPFSEPEARAIRDLLLAHPPAASLHYHCWGELIHYSTELEDTELVELMTDMADSMHQAMLAVHEHYYIIMGVTHFGLAAGWVSATFGAPSFTMELRPGPVGGEEAGGNALPRRELRPTFEENLPAAMLVLDYAVNGW